MERRIFEGGRGASRISAENIIPSNAEKLTFHTRSFEFYVDTTDGQVTLYIQTTDYHPGILAIPLEKLTEFISYILRS